MKLLIALDDGHGTSTPGKRTPTMPSGKTIHENEFNRAVVRFLDQELKHCGFGTILVAPGDADTPLQTRTDIANKAGADAFISIHYNAYNSVFDNKLGGIEIYHNKGSVQGKRLADCVHKYLIKGTKQADRGVKEADFYVLRKTDMPAILSENGFMDKLEEAELMVQEYFQREVAKEHAMGICEYFGVPYVAVVPNQGTPELRAALDVLADAGIINSPSYWVQNAKKGGMVKGEYAEELIIKFANKLQEVGK